jgi:ADP-heptose:LPS heptosyltransferase
MAAALDTTAEPHSVLVYSCGETIGDALFKMPFVRECRRRFPDARLTWVAGMGTTPYATTLAPAMGGLLDEVIENPGIGLPAQLFALRPPLGGRRFDVVVDTQRNVLRTLAVRRIRHGVFVSGTADFLLSDRRPADRKAMPRPLIPRLRCLLELVSDPARAAADPPPLAVDPAFRDLAATLLPAGPIYVGFSPGAGDPTKIWPLDGFVAVARAEAEAGRVPVFLLGPQERDWLARLRAEVPEALFPEWDRADGRPDLKGPVLVIALAARLAAAVANDSGTGHMLAIGGAPLVSLFSKHDPAKYAPAAARLEIVDSKDHGGTDPSLIPVATVSAALRRLLDGVAS